MSPIERQAKETRCQRTYGCSLDEALALNGQRPLRERRSMAWIYADQRGHAKQRGIGWEITFPEWVRVWLDSRHWHERGTGRDRYCMARNGDTGPYRADNVSIQTNQQNWRDGIRKSHATLTATGGWKKLAGRGRGWTYREGAVSPYQVMVAGKYVGTYRTPEEAVAARDAYVAQLNAVQVREAA